LKESAKEKIGFKDEDNLFIYTDETHLEDEFTLMDYNIQEGETIHLFKTKNDYIDYIFATQNTTKELPSNKTEPPQFGNYIIAIQLRGKDSDNMNLTVSGLKRLTNDTDDRKNEDKRIGWYHRSKFKSVKFKIS